MKMYAVILSLGWSAALLAGCAGTSADSGNSSVSSQPGFISTPGNSDNPPVTMSGYLDTSTTTQVK